MQRNVMEPEAGFDTEVAPAIWTLQDARDRTLQTLRGLEDVNLHWAPAATGANSIATVLYHVAAIEADWLATEVLELPAIPAEIMSLFPHDVRDLEGKLIMDIGNLDEHLSRLSNVRDWLLHSFRGIDSSDFRRARKLPQYEVTPEWVLHHLAQHEAEHRGEIGLLAVLGRSNSH